MHLAAVNLETFLQLTANGVFRGAAYGILGVGLALILGVTGRFHFAYGSFYTLAAYLAYTFKDRGLFPPLVEATLPFWVAALAGVMVVVALGCLLERTLYQPLARLAGATELLAVFVAALGIAIALENLIRLLWSSSSQPYFGPSREAWSIGSVTFLNFDVYSAITYAVLTLALAAMLRYTPLGRMVRATRSNPELARTVGIDSKRVYVLVFAIGTFLAGTAAVWTGLQFAVEPGMATRPVIFAFVVAFLAGTASSPIRVFLTGIGVALVEQWSSMWLSVRWTQTAVFVILVAYLSWLSFRQSGVYVKLQIPGLRRQRI
ncbi:MAG: branched-chain amino acid ABC transporter permease [bacterium]|nr:branched-chain amino acid ABC transporter permease [bacterium]MCY4193585.1 branched-chain amino acid ABC transporter permease [bacterium]MCY4272649.1 branched-chain amino acid ABC transporter permease [bacterium]